MDIPQDIHDLSDAIVAHGEQVKEAYELHFIVGVLMAVYGECTLPVDREALAYAIYVLRHLDNAKKNQSFKLAGDRTGSQS